MELSDGYKPNAWQSRFHASSAKHKCAVGGLGSGKTLAGIQELKQLCLEHPGSRWVVGRKYLPNLKDSIWKDLLAIIPDELRASYNKAELVLTLKNGSEILGRPLDDPEKFKSYQLAGFLIEEANEVDKEIYDRLKDRLRQILPDGSRPRYSSIILLNPTDDEHWIPQLFDTSSKPENHEMFRSSTYDNEANLPPDYIDDLKATYSEQVLQSLLHGFFGKVHKGRPVYTHFKFETHVRPIEFDPDLPLIRGWDFGFNHPAVVWLQLKGTQVRVLAEKIGKRIYLQQFVDEQVKPLEEQLFGSQIKKNRQGILIHPTMDFCDPHGADQDDKGKSSVQVLNENQIFPTFRRTYISEGVKAVHECMYTKDVTSGGPNFLINPRCKNLIDGYRGGYHRIDGGEEPEKDGFFDHAQDAARYAILFLKLRIKARELSKAQGEVGVFIDPRTGRRIEFRQGEQIGGRKGKFF